MSCKVCITRVTNTLGKSLMTNEIGKRFSRHPVIPVSDSANVTCTEIPTLSRNNKGCRAPQKHHISTFPNMVKI